MSVLLPLSEGVKLHLDLIVAFCKEERQNSKEQSQPISRTVFSL